MGMLSGLERRPAWPLARGGVLTGCSGCSGRARWDAGGVRGYVAAAFGDPDGVLIGDDTGVREGRLRCSGSTRARPGRSRTASSGCSSPTRAPKGRALVDRELYLPRSLGRGPGGLWRPRSPGENRFRTKPQLLELMIGPAVTAGTPFGWSRPRRPTAATARCGPSAGETRPRRGIGQMIPAAWKSLAQQRQRGRAISSPDCGQPL